MELQVSERTIYTWRRQARIDAGLEAGITTTDQTELAIHRRTTALLKKKADPKGHTRRSE